jgi:hypothetical protein
MAETGSAPAPLLAGREVHRLPGGVLTGHLELDPDRHKFLDHHRIDGKPVLPLVVALELMAEFAAQAEPGWHVAEVQNLRMLCGITLDTPRRAIDLRAEPIERGVRGGEWRVRITDPRLRSRPLYEAMVRLSAEPPVAPAAPALVPASGNFPMSAPEAYRQWLFHGPTFQLIETFRGIDSTGVDASLRRPAVSRAGWVVDPVVLDVAPQLALLWSRALGGTSALPSRIASYRRYATLGDGPCEIALRVHPDTDGQIIKSDVWFLSRGRLLGEIRGLEGARSVELNRIGGGGSR